MAKKRNPITDHAFVMVEMDNWEGLYIDGILVEEGHCADVDLIAWLRKYGLNIRHEGAYGDESAAEAGHFPGKLKKLKLD